MKAKEPQPRPAGQRAKLLTCLPDDSGDGDEEEAEEDDGQSLGGRGKGE